MASKRPSDFLFCRECGNLLDMPGESDYVTCNQCNFTQHCSVFEQHKVVTRSRPQAFASRKGANSFDVDDEWNGAVIEEICSKCGHDKMKFFTMQLRSSDEGQTVFYVCLKCNHTYSLNS